MSTMDFDTYLNQDFRGAWNGSSAYVSLISLMGFCFAQTVIFFWSQIHTSPVEITEHLQLEEYVSEEISHAEVSYSRVKSSTVIYCMRQDGPDRPLIQPS